MTDRERLLDKLRPVPFATACWMPSSISNAEDMAQEARLRLYQALQAGEQIASPRAFAATVTTRPARVRVFQCRYLEPRRQPGL
jgi:DNA-directed RNA polymerase specialized sigma24 family protein